MNYTISEQGGRWIASNGTDHAEGDTPDDALFALMEADQDNEANAVLDELRQTGEIEDAIFLLMIGLIRLIATRAPAPLLRSHAQVIAKRIEELIAARE